MIAKSLTMPKIFLLRHALAEQSLTIEGTEKSRDQIEVNMDDVLVLNDTGIGQGMV